MTLEIILKDELSEAYVHLFYSIFEDLDVITRSAYIENKGKNSFHVVKAYSMTLDLPDDNYYLTHFYGDWCKEKIFVEENFMTEKKEFNRIMDLLRIMKIQCFS